MCGLAEGTEDRTREMSAKQKPSETRKVRKPLMEKRRRARINDSLDELKRMLALETTPGVEQTTRSSKLEKADILELTVRHFQRLQRGDIIGTRPTDVPGSRLNDVTDCPERKFAAGFRACAQTTKQILGEFTGLDVEVKKRLTAHLSSCLETLQTEKKPTLAKKNTLITKNESSFVRRGSGDCYPLPDSTQNISDNESVKDSEGLKVFPVKLGNGSFAYVMPASCNRVRGGVVDEMKKDDGVWRPW